MKKKYLLVISILVLIFFTFHSRNFRIDASSDTLVAQNDEDFKFFNSYNDIFPSRNFLVLAIKSDKEIDDKYIKVIESLSKELVKLQEIESVFSINHAPILFLNKTSLLDLSNKKIETILNTNFELKEIINEFSSSSILKDQIINSNKNISSIIIYLKKNEEFIKLKNENKNSPSFKTKNKYIKIKSELDQKRNDLIKNIRFIIKNSNPDYEYFLGGIDMIADDVISFVKKDIIIFSVAVLFLIVFVLFIIFRDVKWIIINLLTSSYAVLCMFGILGFLNIEITAVSSNFASLMFILSISMNIHIINNYKQNYDQNPKYLSLTLKRMVWPCIYTVLTTIVAFASLLISDIKPIIDFGLIMILSLSLILISSFSILPLLISYFPDPKNSKNIKFTILDKFYFISTKHSNKIIFINIFFLILSIFGILNLNVENSFINYFKKNTDIYKGMKIIDTELGGTTPLDIIITFNDENKESNVQKDEDNLLLEEDLIVDDLFEDQYKNSIWFTQEKLSTIKEIHKYLENRDEIGKVQSIHSLLEVANQLNPTPLTIFELEVLYNEIPENYKKDLIDPFLSTENNMIKISSRVKDSEKINRNLLIKEINNYLENNHKNLKEFKVNGLLILYNNMLQSLFSSQIKSLGFVIFSIFLMFIILFKSLELSILGIIPNIIASSTILGMIGLFRIPLDIMTITIAAITIGIAVDNTIHYLYRYKENLKTTMDISAAIQLSHNNVGYAVLTTSITIAFGFSVLALSNFIPTILFGIFTSLAMIIAMVGVLLTLPSLLKKFSR